MCVYVININRVFDFLNLAYWSNYLFPIDNIFYLPLTQGVAFDGKRGMNRFYAISLSKLQA